MCNRIFQSSWTFYAFPFDAQFHSLFQVKTASLASSMKATFKHLKRSSKRHTTKSKRKTRKCSNGKVLTSPKAQNIFQDIFVLNPCLQAPIPKHGKPWKWIKVQAASRIKLESRLQTQIKPQKKKSQRSFSMMRNRSLETQKLIKYTDTNKKGWRKEMKESIETWRIWVREKNRMLIISEINHESIIETIIFILAALHYNSKNFLINNFKVK